MATAPASPRTAACTRATSGGNCGFVTAARSSPSCAMIDPGRDRVCHQRGNCGRGIRSGSDSAQRLGCHAGQHRLLDHGRPLSVGQFGRQLGELDPGSSENHHRSTEGTRDRAQDFPARVRSIPNRATAHYGCAGRAAARAPASRASAGGLAASARNKASRSGRRRLRSGAAGSRTRPPAIVRCALVSRRTIRSPYRNSCA